MTEYFILANSFAAPWFSDESTEFVKAETPQKALAKFAKQYRHPCGLFAANCYASAEDYHKHKDPLAQWLCNHEQEKQRLTKDKDSFSYRGHAPGDFEINGERHKVRNPKGGSIAKGKT